jgi:4-diphosphocytidyl-2-C-methyl-D-erythritol kinase
VDGANLVVRAAHAFLDALRDRPGAGAGAGIRIHLTKRIPHGAGLGGGSSDAAATLRALNTLFHEPLAPGELARIAATIGSDVPFFLAPGAAWCRGRGEIVEPCASPGVLPLLLLKPPFPVPTPWAYRQWRDSLEIPGVPYTAQRFDWGSLLNDLERPVFEKYIQLAEMKRWFLGRPGVGGALMSGSGSTMFAVLRDRASGPPLIEEARAQFGPHVWLALVETR